MGVIISLRGVVEARRDHVAIPGAVDPFVTLVTRQLFVVRAWQNGREGFTARDVERRSLRRRAGVLLYGCRGP